MPTPTIKTRKLSASAIIGRNIRPGMTPGGMMTSAPASNNDRSRVHRRKCMEVQQAAMAFLENRVVRS